MRKEIKGSEENVCPKCGHGSLEYGERDVMDFSVSWQVQCLECNWEGEEVHDMRFSHMEEFVEED